ncbi:MAG: hypothetical protein ACI9IP_002946 [Arcticibacterium sp.]|jgi:hypothetical protein
MKKVVLGLLMASIFTACSSSSSSETEETTEVSEASAHNFDMAKTSLTWTAFKTPDKIGVPGTFDEITLTGNSFIINTKSVNSNNEIRDYKLVKFFFDNLSDSLITGSYGSVTNRVMPVTLKMNGIEKTVDFAVSESDTATIVSGTIDILSDFSGNAALEGIAEACKELHLNKTWSDVTLKVVEMK